MALAATAKSWYPKSEVILAMVWLGFAAVISCIMEAALLDFTVQVAWGEQTRQIPVPWCLIAACWFNWVLSRTAALWSPQPVTAMIPVMIWAATALGLASLPQLTGDIIFLPSFLYFLLVICGLVGALPVWVQRTRQRRQAFARERQGQKLANYT